MFFLKKKRSFVFLENVRNITFSDDHEEDDLTAYIHYVGIDNTWDTISGQDAKDLYEFCLENCDNPNE